jgi:hypothetical protein
MSSSNIVIVKVQRPLSGPGPFLAYEADRETLQQLDTLPPAVRKVMRNDFKAYFNARRKPVG